MRRDETIARILLIFSVANIALAAPAVVRQRQIGVAEAASGKRGNSEVETTVGSYGSMPELMSASDSETDAYFSAPGSPLGSLHQGALFHDGSESSRYLPEWPFDAHSTTPYGSALPSPELPLGPSHQGASLHDGSESSQYLPEWPFDADSTTTEDPKSTSNNALKKKLKIYGALVTAAGISTGVIYEVHKKIKGTRSFEAYVSALLLPSPADN